MCRTHLPVQRIEYYHLFFLHSCIKKVINVFIINYLQKMQFFPYSVPLVATVTAQTLTSRSVMVSWKVSNDSIIDNFTVSYISLCNNVRGSLLLENGTSNSTVINSLYPGLQYSISITAANLLGKGMERTVTATLEGNGNYIYCHLTLTNRFFIVIIFYRSTHWSSSVTKSCID